MAVDADLQDELPIACGFKQVLCSIRFPSLPPAKVHTIGGQLAAGLEDVLQRMREPAEL
nr:hypothetical protein [Rhizobium sp. IE4771]